MTPQNPIILLRDDVFVIEDDERLAMRDYFPVVTSRLDVPPNSLVIGRLSVLPFYKELEDDLARNNSQLINSYRQHRFVADLGNWYARLIGHTPPTFTVNELPHIKDDPVYDGYVLKGETNSRKNMWDTHMFAPDWQGIMPVMQNLFADSLIGSQNLFIRRRARLKEFFRAFHGLPVTNEYRVFVAYGQVLGSAFYWTNYASQIPVADRVPPPMDWVKEMVSLVGDSVNAYTLDVALCEDGTWIVIELNDLQMAGLSDNDPDQVYGRLARVIAERAT